MAWTVDRTKLHEFTIEDPESGAEAAVFIRKLDQGDMEDRQDMLTKMRMSSRRGDQDKPAEESLSLAIGAVRRFDMRRSIVKWEIPLKLNEKTLRDLEPSVADQIYAEINKLNPRLNGGDGSRARKPEPADPSDEEYGDSEGEDPNL